MVPGTLLSTVSLTRHDATRKIDIGPFDDTSHAETGDLETSCKKLCLLVVGLISSFSQGAAPSSKNKTKKFSPVTKLRTNLNLRPVASANYLTCSVAHQGRIEARKIERRARRKESRMDASM
ncbi:hypothetical protein LY78DRAFT_58227 [Colletotrichum sublineola]|nr:hypothetical protein LY78DRAFT_58227 [Colletotrichum sublineola]